MEIRFTHRGNTINEYREYGLITTPTGSLIFRLVVERENRTKKITFLNSTFHELNLGTEDEWCVNSCGIKAETIKQAIMTSYLSVSIVRQEKYDKNVYRDNYGDKPNPLKTVIVAEVTCKGRLLRYLAKSTETKPDNQKIKEKIIKTMLEMGFVY